MSENLQQIEKKTSLANFLNFPNTKKFLEDALKDKKTDFVSNLLALSDNDKNIATCDPSKLMMCAMNATALNLPLNKNLGYAYVIAYKGIPQFQIGYKGLIQLALRSGMYKFINACDVRAGEIRRNKFTGEIDFIKENTEGEVVGYLAFLQLLNGFSASVYMTNNEIEAHALRFSTAYQYDVLQKKKTSKWSDINARPKMAKKTVLKALLGTYGILSTEIIKAFEFDNDNEADNNSNNRTINIDIVEQAGNESATQQPKKVKI